MDDWGFTWTDFGLQAEAVSKEWLGKTNFVEKVERPNPSKWLKLTGYTLIALGFCMFVAGVVALAVVWPEWNKNSHIWPDLPLAFLFWVIILIPVCLGVFVLMKNETRRK
jgi:hypothetical protein